MSIYASLARRTISWRVSRPLPERTWATSSPTRSVATIITQRSDLRATEDTLAFAGISPPQLRIYPIETHVAEKLHAFTMPRPRPNSRVKDLPDIALLASIGALNAEELKTALEKTFEFRKTHPLPQVIPPPPSNWEGPYLAIARENQLDWSSLTILTSAVSAFLNPVLAGEMHRVWSPETWSWAQS